MHLVSFITMTRGILASALSGLLVCVQVHYVDTSYAAQGNQQSLAQAAPSGKEGVRQPVQAEVRIGRHPDFVRAVFLTEEGYVQKAAVSQSGSISLEVLFPSPVIFTHIEKGIFKNDTPFEIAKGVKIAVRGPKAWITVEQLSTFKVSRFTSPSRLVIDAYTGSPPSASTAPSPEKPLVPPPPDTPVREFGSFLLDAGHGGYDKGLREEGFSEKDLALSFTRDLAAALTRKGKKVYLSRKSDHALSLRERINLARQKAPDIVLSIHVSAGNELVVYSALRKEGKSPQDDWSERNRPAEADIDAATAKAVAQAIANDFGFAVSHEKLPIPLLVHTRAPAVMIELPNPLKFSYDGKDKERLINAIIRGITHPAAVQ